MTQKIEAGYFDNLAVKALADAVLYPARRGLPRSGRQASGRRLSRLLAGAGPSGRPRLGGAAALHRMVEAAHRHGIRILMDAVLNHVHEGH